MNHLKQILFVTATTLEAKLLCEELFPDHPIEWNREPRFLYMTIPLPGDYTLVLIVTGMGTKRAYQGLKQALSMFQHVDSVIGFGLAGGLIKTAKRGDLVVPKTVHTKDAKWIPLLSLKNFVHDSKREIAWNKLLTLDQVIQTPVEKAGVYAASGMEAVDMESGAWAQVCVESNITSWGIVRVIMDGGEETLPDMSGIVGGMGEIVPHKALLHFLTHPGHLLKAMKFKPSKLKEIVSPGADVLQSFLASKRNQESHNSR